MGVRQRFDSFLLCFVKTHIVYSTDQVSYFTELKMRGLFMCMIVVAAGVYAEDGACYSHLSEHCDSPGENWSSDGPQGTCNSVHGGFKGNSNNLHRIVIDDFTDSINYMLMSSAFSTDKVNRMGFSKYFMDQSDGMWARGKDMIKYILKRGGKMGGNFQIPTSGPIGDIDYSNEMTALGVNLDMLKDRASDIIKSYRHSLSVKNADTFDPATAHKLEELSEDYSGEINDVAKKINSLGKMVRQSSSSAIGTHLFDRSLM